MHPGNNEAIVIVALSDVVLEHRAELLTHNGEGDAPKVGEFIPYRR